MAFDAYLKLDGIEGEATRKGFERQIFLDSFSWGAHNPSSPIQHGGSSGGHVEISRFTVSKKTDKSSPKLFGSCCKGTHFKEATVTLLKHAGGTYVEYLKYHFNDLMVGDIQWSGAANGSDDTPQETVGFSFGKVEISYTTQTAKGEKGAAIVESWNLQTGMAS